jgi:hypothetical protein
MVAEFNVGNALSIQHVYEEICAGGDDLTDWLKNNLKKNMFKDCLADNEVVNSYMKVAHYVETAYKENIAVDFLSDTVADPWLVAYAMEHGGCIVTLETPKPNRKKVSLVDVCDHFTVRYVNVIDFLRFEQARFVYPKQTITK